MGVEIGPGWYRGGGGRFDGGGGGRWEEGS